MAKRITRADKKSAGKFANKSLRKLKKPTTIVYRPQKKKTAPRVHEVMQPSMPELATERSVYRLPCNGHAGQIKKALWAIDLFAGCGGLSLGLEKAGFTPILFSEINHSAAETYIANRSELDLVPVGDIHSLTDTNLRMLQTYWKYKGIKDIDLVCGGPPCQGYSGIGHRRTFKLHKKDIPSNQLFTEMIRVISVLRPKIFMFENVRGLLHSRWNPDGKNGEIFIDVLTAFRSIPGYNVKWDLLHAKDYGVPQNRPRIIIIGIREDIISKQGLLVLQEEDPFNEGGAIQRGFLPPPVGQPPSLEELLSDLEDPSFETVSQTLAYPSSASNPVQELLRTRRDGSILAAGDPLTEQEYSSHSKIIRDKFRFMIDNHGAIPVDLKTKKFAQRVMPATWGKDGPNITATSLPDDYVHYRQARSPTVREWARIQTFPDWYVFKGPRTTGGRRRAGDPSAGIWERDVPKYTQIGNAVPVLLAQHIGKHLRDRFLI